MQLLSKTILLIERNLKEITRIASKINILDVNCSIIYKIPKLETTCMSDSREKLHVCAVLSRSVMSNSLLPCGL